MRALRYHGPKKPLRLEDVPTPDPGPGEVLVRVTAAGICHTELHFLSGLLDLGIAPLTLGHEIVGRIEKVGDGVPAGRAGERVIVYYYVGCGGCPHCLGGDENLCDARLAGVGLGDWVVVYGIGAVGFGLVQVAKLRGARVIAVGRTPAKLEAARALGAAHVGRGGAEDVAARGGELTSGRGADAVFE